MFPFNQCSTLPSHLLIRMLPVFASSRNAGKCNKLSLARVVVLGFLIFCSTFSPASAALTRSGSMYAARYLQGDALCFAQNGLCISGEFRTFWEKNGGIEVLGLPISPAYNAPVISTSTKTTTRTTQTSPDTTETTTVITTISKTSYYLTQWFERASFELHPENNEPYRILMGRLGDMALRKTDRSPGSFARADPGSAYYFPETGQSIAPQFWDYWRRHGLAMGHDGVSLQESLALFGYPISPPITEKLSDGKEYIVQYFERARFEHHPENSDPRYQVLLGLLGKSLMPASAPTAGAGNALPAGTAGGKEPASASNPVPAQAAVQSQPPAPEPATSIPPTAPSLSVPPRERASSALARLNWYRHITGLGQYSMDGALARAGAAHANYLVHNPPGDFHNEARGREGFTGVTPLDRAQAAGYHFPSGYFVTDLVVDTDDQLNSIDQLFDLPMHRVLLLNPQYTQMGIGTAVHNGRAFTVVVIATGPVAALPKGEPRVVSYPVNGQSEVPVSWDYSEWPSPYPAGSATPLGYPLTLTGAYGPLRVDAASLKDASGAEVSVHTNPAVCTSNPAYNCFQLMPVKPLRPGTTYIVYARGLLAGKAFESSWSFKTGTASVP